MSLSRIGHDILKETTELQVAVYEYLEFDTGDETGTATIVNISKRIIKLVRQLKKEDQNQ
jgi:hypothetical protein